MSKLYYFKKINSIEKVPVKYLKKILLSFDPIFHKILNIFIVLPKSS